MEHTFGIVKIETAGPTVNIGGVLETASERGYRTLPHSTPEELQEILTNLQEALTVDGIWFSEIVLIQDHHRVDSPIKLLHRVTVKEVSTLYLNPKSPIDWDGKAVIALVRPVAP